FPFCSVLDDSDTATSSVQRAATDILPEGLVRELPDEDTYVEPPAAPASCGAIDDDLEELQRQLDALNSS
uniref:Uncharacterized protein n=1 Tax=Aegilops tauschii subsp. strangulata TaxID=200361 RepID=A0A453QPT1_AEGTS